MKKITIIIGLTVLLLSVLAITIFALNSQEKSAPVDDVEAVEISAFERLSSVITSDNGAFALAKFNQKEIFADLSRDNMREIFNAFDVVLEKNDTIEIKDTMYHRSMLNNEKIKYTLNNDVDLEYIYCTQENGEEIVLSHEGKITIPTDQNPDTLKFVMFTSVYMELFPNNWTYGYTQQQIEERNSEWTPRVHIFPDYAEYGFTSAFDAFQSYYNVGSKYTEKYFWLADQAAFPKGSTSLIKKMNEIMKKSEDSYVLEYFFFELERSAEFAKEHAMPKKVQAAK